MGAPIGPGDFVECVDVLPRPWSDAANVRSLAQLRPGQIYRVRAVGRWHQPDPNLMLDGVKAAYEADGIGWSISRFRPIYRRDEGLVQRLLTSLPADLVPA